MANDPERLRAVRSGEATTVPIGQTIFTNKRESSVELTLSALANQRSYSGDGKKIVRDVEKKTLTYADLTRINDKRIVQASFKNDSLVLVRENGEEFLIEGFLRQPDYGIGATGPRGNRGRDGIDGFDGEDGSEGDAGCQGDKGPSGDDGEPGKDGKEGDQGSRGPEGCEGPRGEVGDAGNQGIIGFEGERGPKGLTCKTTSGSGGSQGAALRTNVVISSNAPDNLTVMWGIPQ